MFNPIQKNYGKQQVGFSAVKFNDKPFEETTFKTTFQEAVYDTFRPYIPEKTTSDEMANRLAGKLKPLIEKYSNSAQTLNLFITKIDKANWIGASVSGSHGQPTGLANMSPLLTAERDFFKGISDF